MLTNIALFVLQHYFQAPTNTDISLHTGQKASNLSSKKKSKQWVHVLEKPRTAVLRDPMKTVPH